MNSSDVDEIYRNAKKDPALFSKLDPEDLLRELAKDKHNYIENKTNASIMKEIKQSIVDEFGEEMPDKQLAELTKNLIGYRGY